MAGLTGLFNELLKIFTGPNFENSSSILLRLELTEFIKKQCRKKIYKPDNRNPEILSNELKTIVEGYDEGCLLDNPEVIDEIFYFITNGADPNIKIRTEVFGVPVELPLLNFFMQNIYDDINGIFEYYEAFRDIIACLLIYGADVNYCHKFIPSPLSSATFHNTFPTDLIRSLIIFGADVNQRSIYGRLVFVSFTRRSQ